MSSVPSKTVLSLTLPIKVDGEQVTEIHVRRATARDMRELPAGSIKKIGELYDFAASCCDIPPSSLEQLDAHDLTKVMEIVAGFLAAGIRAVPSR